MVAACFDVGRIGPNIRPLAFERTGQERLHLFVDLAAQAGGLAFADPRHAERFERIIHGTGGDALDAGLLDDGGQRPNNDCGAIRGVGEDNFIGRRTEDG